MLISNRTIVFKISAQKYPKKSFWSQNYAFLLLHELCQFNEFKGVDFKYGNSFLEKFQPQNIQHQTFFNRKLGFLS